MPANIGSASPIGTFPNMTYLAMSKVSEWQTSVSQYPDGSSQRYSIPATAPRVRFKLRAKLGAGESVANGAIGTGTPDLTSASNPWVAADAGKAISVAGAGASGRPLVTYILTYVSAGAVTLGANAGTTVAAAETIWSTTGNPPMGVLKALHTACRGRHGALLFYWPWDRTVPFSYDPSGTELDGRYTVRWDSDFREEWNLSRGELEIELVEID